MMKNEKPGGHGERSVAVGTIDMAIWDLVSKIEDKPYESNPITEWGVKYEDIAILFYEELYNVKVLDFGLIPHPTFKAFGASPDGICDDTGNDEYVSRKRRCLNTECNHENLTVELELSALEEMLKISPFYILDKEKGKGKGPQ